MPDWLTLDAPFLPRMLKEDGYATAHYGKWHLSNEMIPDSPGPGKYGFDDYGAFNCSGEQMPWNEDAKHAIAELRDLVRGIHPAVLTDRGLDAAVSALVARCPVPVALECDVPHRLSPAIESTAYFVVAEALTNLAKHSGAKAASVSLQLTGHRLLMEILDNGRGGADESAGTGLRGLRDRVAGVEGELRLSSPVGGPTVVTVELPCAS